MPWRAIPATGFARSEQARFVDVKVIGEFEDAEWVVLPPGRADQENESNSER